LRKKAEDLRSAAANALRFLEEAGADFVVRRAAPPRASAFPVPARSPIPQDGPPPDPSRLSQIMAEVLACQKCPLSRVRDKAVPGEGGLDSGLMFVGEAPGADENTAGRPFVGKAGQLLSDIIKAMRFSRSEVYITNVVKCQPPGNRTPFGSEIDVCASYLQRQLEAIQPKVIVALGAVAAGVFVPGEVKISALRGTWFDYGRIKVMPTFHPSYLLRNAGNRSLKKSVWEDMQKVMAYLEKR